MVVKIVAAGEGSGDDTKVINKVASAVEKANPGIDGLDVKGNLAAQRKKVVDLQKQVPFAVKKDLLYLLNPYTSALILRLLYCCI